MFNTTQVNFKVAEKDSTKGVFKITPLVEGFGYTIGSALRRTLYSSIRGAAITYVKIDGVSHQFDTIPGVRDDVLHIILALKSVRFRKNVEEPVELELSASGKGDVKAGDIQTVSGVEIVNKDFVITSLADKKSVLKMKMTVESGYGYSKVDESKTHPVGTIALDANYSPIVNVVIDVSDTRVGRDKNFDELTLAVTTDGTIDPEDAARNAAELLKEFFYKVQTGEDYTESEDKALKSRVVTEAKESKKISTQLDEVVLEELHLPTRTINALRKAGIKTLGDLVDKSEDELLRVRNLGEKSIREITALLKKEGVK